MSESTMPEVVTNETPAAAEKKKEKKPKPRRKRSRIWRKIKKLIKLLILLIVLLIVGLFALKAYITTKAAESADSSDYSRATVQSGAMSETVYGTGTTSAKNQPNILAEADGTLTDLRVSIGDEVKEGDILAVITNDEIDDTITEYEFALWELDATIQDTSAGSSVLSVRAPMAGRVMAIYAQAGDDALAVFRREGALAIISTDGRMRVEIDDVPKAIGLTLGDTVQVTGATTDITGTVSDLTLQGTHATITITSDNLPMGEEVTVTTLSGQTVGTGELEVNKPMAVSSYGGTISAVRVKVGQKVERKDTLFALEDSPLTLTLEDLRLQREAAAKNLADAKAQRENLIIVAPCDGTIASLNVSEGDSISSGTLFGSILQGEEMSLTIAVDELDVVEVEVGQKVTITIDALSDLEMSGEVYKIAPVGTNSGGVTTYDVELAFDATGSGVRSGMNATGEIEIASKSSTLYVPVEAIMTINNTTYVMVEDGGTQTLSSAASQSESKTTSSSSFGGFGGMGDMGGMPGMSQMGDRSSRGGRGSGSTQSSEEGSMPDMSQMSGEMPEGLDASSLPEGFDASALPGADAQAESAGVMATVKKIYDGVMAWLYEGTESADTITGSLVQVTVGMQNDDYAEILSGVSAGQTVLYTGDSSDSSTSSSFSMGGMGGGRGGDMGGGMGGMMGF